MSILAEVILVPLIFLGALGWLAATGRRKGLLLGVGLFAATMAAGIWEISQSRSSTAAIGLIFLPFLAATAGLAGIGYGRWRDSSSAPERVLGWVALVVGLILPGSLIVGGWRSIQRNARRDADQASHEAAVAANRTTIATMLATAGRRGPDSLERLVRLRLRDRDFLIAALARPELSAPLLDTLARLPDIGVALVAVNNPTTRAETLEWVYRSSSYPDYFYQALAAHPHTPAAVLREIRGRRTTPITGLDIWFAGNPATPPDILDEISRTSASPDVVRSLLRNPSIDCRMARQVAAGPAVAQHPSDDDLAPRAAELVAALCH